MIWEKAQADRTRHKTSKGRKDMGMDVYGRNNPDAYFRNNVWWWRPLWDYCNKIAPELCGKVNGHFNEGDGLDEDEALKLAAVIGEEIESGRALAYEADYNAYIASLPRHECEYCGGTGVRDDEIGVSMGMPTKELDPAVSIIVGRTHGWCNACGGEGMKDHPEASYPFSLENLIDFFDFLEECGGFSIS
jgi:hypothetical protein